LSIQALSKSWDEVDDETKLFCKTVYDRELVKYYKETKEYIELYGKAVFDSQKKVYKKRASQEDDAIASTKSDSSKKPASKKEKNDASSSSSQWKQSCEYTAYLQMNPYSHPSRKDFNGYNLGTASHHSIQLQNRLFSSINDGGNGWNMMQMQHHARDSSASLSTDPSNHFHLQMNLCPYPSQIGNATNLPFHHDELIAASHYSNQLKLQNMVVGRGSFYNPVAPYIPVQRSHHDHVENQTAVPTMQVATHQLPCQTYAASHWQPDFGARNQHYAFNEGSRESNRLFPMGPSQNHTVANLLPQVQDYQASFQQEHSYSCNPMYSLMNTNERWVAAKPDNDTNNEGNVFDNDSESDISLALDENDVGNILCGEELENVFDRVWGLDD
jgi:hypothetical protein